jgi:hypothetical protein
MLVRQRLGHGATSGTRLGNYESGWPQKLVEPASTGSVMPVT